MVRLPGTGGEDLDGLIARFEDLVMRILQRIADAAARLLGGTPDPVRAQAVSLDDLGVIRGQWTQALDTDVLPALAAVYDQAAAALVADLGAAGRDVAALAAPDAAAFLGAARNRLVGVGDRLWEAARDELGAGLRAGEDAGQLAVRVRGAAGVAEPRARVIARSEVVAANNAASLATARMLGDPTVIKEWLATPDGRTRETHRHADGQRVRIGERFAVGAAHLDYPGDPTSPFPDETANCRCSIALDLDDEPAITASADMEGEHTMADPTTQPAGQDQPVPDATPDVPTGAMVALIPSDADAARLVVDGGEPVDQLHCTLLYLGEAAAIPDAGRQNVVDRVTALVQDDLVPDFGGPLVADGFSVNLFNPPGVEREDGRQRDTCIVLGLSGDDLDALHGMVEDAVDEVDAADDGWEMPAQHAPWTPHVTLAYTSDAGQVAALADRVGPVTFDRIRVVFAGDATDIPLGSPAASGTAGPDSEPVTAAGLAFAPDVIGDFQHSDEKLRAYWTEGIGAAKIGWNTPGDFTRCVKHLRKYVADPKGLCAEYHHEATGMWPGDKRNRSDGGVAFNDGEMSMATPAPPVKAPAVKAGKKATPAPPPAEQPACPDGWHPDDDGDCQPDDPNAQGCPDGWVPDDDGDCQPAPQQQQPPAVPPRGGCAEGQHRDPVSGGCVPNGNADAAPTEHFHAIMHVEGVSTGMRTFVEGALEWRDPPFAFHWQRGSSAHNGTPETVQVGNVTRVERDGNTIHGWGRLDLACPEGLDYARRLVEGFARWVSIGLDESLKEADIEYVWPDGGDGDGEDSGLEMLFAEPEEMIFHKGRIAELSGVSIPAQAEAVIEPTPALLDALAERGVLVAAAVGSHKTGTSDGSWDAAANEKRLPSPMKVATARKVYAWIDDSAVDGGEVPKSGAKFPHHEVAADGTPGAANLAGCSAGIAALHGGRGGASIPDADRKGVYNHLAAHIRAGGGEPPEFDAGPIVAAGHIIEIQDCPPAWWFDEPADVTPHGALTVTDDGRIYGYLAPDGIAHRSFPGRRKTVPMGRVDYDRWMGGEAIVAGGGRVVAGPITMECGHMPPDADDRSDVRMQHYDNACSVVAKARVGENRRGVWIAGALEPGVSADQVSRMLACRLSGDWAPHPERPGWREFVAALLVPVPGFPMARSAPSVRVAEGVLVASAVPVRLAHPGDDTVAKADLRPALERVARSIGRDAPTRLRALHSRVHAEGR